MLSKPFVKDAFGWGFVLWLVGYVLGIALFFVVPPSMLGWVIMPVGVLLALWVLWKKVQGKFMGYYLSVGIIWTLIAVVLDYVLLVSVFKPADGYYKLDVYVYYALTFLLPLIAGFFTMRTKKDVNAPTV